MNDKEKLDMIDTCCKALADGKKLWLHIGDDTVLCSNVYTHIIENILHGPGEFAYTIKDEDVTPLDAALKLVAENGYEVVKKEPEVKEPKAVKLETGIEGFSITIGSDEVWLWFDSDRQSAGVNMTAIADERKNPTRSCLNSWINQTVAKYGNGMLQKLEN